MREKYLRPEMRKAFFLLVKHLTKMMTFTVNKSVADSRNTVNILRLGHSMEHTKNIKIYSHNRKTGFLLEVWMTEVLNVLG